MNNLCRRNALLGITALAAVPAFAQAPQPVLWRLAGRNGDAHILGFSEAKDRSWLVPKVQVAFDQSQEIWFEVPQQNPLAQQPAQPPQASPPRAQASDPAYSERDLFQSLPSALSDRLLAAAQKYGVPRSRLEHVKPWRAYFVLNSAYLSKTGAGQADLENFADIVLSGMAYRAGKVVRSEFATNADAMAHFVSMPETEAEERLGFLLDYLDEEEAGGLADRYTGSRDAAIRARLIA